MGSEVKDGKVGRMGVLMKCVGLALVMATMVVGQGRPKQMTIAAIFDQGGDPKHELAKSWNLYPLHSTKTCSPLSHRLLGSLYSRCVPLHHVGVCCDLSLPLRPCQVFSKPVGGSRGPR